MLKQIIIGIRTIRSEANIPPGNELPVFVVHATALDTERLQRNEAYLGRLAKVSSITILGAEDEVPVSLMALCGELKSSPNGSVIDVDAELSNDKELEVTGVQALWKALKPSLCG